MSGGGGGGNTTTTQRPWDQQQPYLIDLFRRAQQLVNRPTSAYQGSGVAAMTPQQRQAIAAAGGAARQQGQLASSASNYLQSLMNPLSYGAAARQVNAATPPASIPRGMSQAELLDVGNNRFVQRAADSATRPLYQQLTESVMPSIRGESMASGFYGGNRQGIAEGLAAGRTAQAAGDVTNRLYSDAYSRGLEALTAQRGQTIDALTQQRGQTLAATGNLFDTSSTAGGRALALTPSIQQSQTMPLATLSAAGTAQQQFNQAQLNDVINRYYYNQGLPFQQLAQYQQLLQGGYGGSATMPRQQQNPLMAGAGGVLLGGATGGMFGGPMGAGIGAGIGGLLSLATLF